MKIIDKIKALLTKTKGAKPHAAAPQVKKAIVRKSEGPTKHQQKKWATWTRREKIAKKSRKINYQRG